MKVFQNQKSYPILLMTPAGNNVTVLPGKGVEGDFFSRFTHLTEVPSLDPAAIVWSQSARNEKGKAYLTLMGKYEAPATPAPVQAPVAAPVAKEEVSEEVPPVVPEGQNLKDLPRFTLVSMATKLGIENAKGLKKDELVQAIEAAK